MNMSVTIRFIGKIKMFEISLGEVLAFIEDYTK